MAFDIAEFRSHLPRDGARPTLFQAYITNPIFPGADVNAPYRIMAATLPPSSLGTIQIPYMGRAIKTAGDRVFAPWTVQILNDEDFDLRNAFETWSNAINGMQANIRETGSSNWVDYTSQARINQLSKTGDISKVYEFRNLWPAEVGQIQVSWDMQNQFETFPVTFQYDYWVDPNSGNL